MEFNGDVRPVKNMGSTMGMGFTIGMGFTRGMGYATDTVCTTSQIGPCPEIRHLSLYKKGDGKGKAEENCQLL